MTLRRMPPLPLQTCLFPLFANTSNVLQGETFTEMVMITGLILLSES